MTARLSIPDVFEQVKKKRKRDERIAVLQSHDSPSLRQILYVAFHPDVVVALPNSRPDFEKSIVPTGYDYSHLHQVARKLKVLIKDYPGYENLRQSKRENLFIQMLESISPDEAELLLQICIDRKVKQRSINVKLVSDAFPGLLDPKPQAQPDKG
jgi:hypothetical protein